MSKPGSQRRLRTGNSRRVPFGKRTDGTVRISLAGERVDAVLAIARASTFTAAVG